MLFLFLFSCRVPPQEDPAGLDSDLDGFTSAAGDCDDHHPLSHPGAQELCDGLDNDCDGELDEDAGIWWYQDADGDRFGSGESTLQSCFAVDGYTELDGDCDDADPAVSPLATELCDGVDNDCNGTVDDAEDGGYLLYADGDGDGYGSSESWVRFCSPEADGYSAQDGDCDDSDGSVRPGAPDQCADGLDADCDGEDSSPYCDQFLGEVGYRFTEDYFERVGNGFGCVGDLNGDGITDIAVGSGNSSTRRNDEPRSFVFFGPIDEDRSPASADAILVGEPGEAGGSVLRGGNPAILGGVPGDIDGDGYDDLLVGVISSTGRIHVFNGPVAGELALDLASPVDGLADSSFGRSLAMLGDLDGDGIGDFGAAAHRATAGDAANAGAVYLFTQTEPVESIDDATAVVYGGYDDNAGYSLAPAGDLNGDGTWDVLIGAYRADAPSGEDGIRNAGAGFVLHGPFGSESVLSDADLVLYGDQETGSLGVAASADDIDGDGTPDLILSTPFHTAGDLSDAGVVYLFSGTAQGEASPDDALATILGEAEEDNLGRTVAGVGDLDGDGFSELLVGVKRSDRGETDGGAALLYFGPIEGSLSPDDASAIWLGEDESSWAGISLASAGDADGDGVPDLLIGSNVYDEEIGLQGAGYFLPGSLFR